MKKLILILLLSINSLIIYSQKCNEYHSGWFPYETLLWNAKHNFHSTWIMTSVSYPVNHGSLKGYHISQHFQHSIGKNVPGHLGIDINGNILGNADLGDTIYCLGKGRVVEITADNSVVIILHKTIDGFVTSQYRHCMETFVYPGQYIDESDPIARIGNDNGIFFAHLHFEIRSDIESDSPGCYGDPKGYLDPYKYIIYFNKVTL